MDKKYQDYRLIEAILAKLSLDQPDLKFPFNVGLTQTFSSSSQKFEEIIQDLLFSKDKFLDYKHPIVLFEGKDALEIAEQGTSNLSNRASPTDLAYVMYTSGSTGKPKGVLVEHRSVIGPAGALINKFDIKPKDKLLQVSPSIIEGFNATLFGTLFAGSSFFLIPKTMKLFGDNLLQVIKKESISILRLSPSILNTFPIETNLPALRLLLIEGQDPSVKTIKKWSQYHLQIANLYGATEARLCTVSFIKLDSIEQKISIGKPIGNKKLYVLDQNCRPMPIGVAGELYIGGVVWHEDI